jgi:hypothetical protein
VAAGPRREDFLTSDLTVENSTALSSLDQGVDGTSLAPGEEQFEMVRRRKFPVVGDGGGVWSFIHFADAADATVAAIEHGRRGVYNVVDDDPPRSPSGCPRLRRPWAPRSRCACRGSSRGCSPVRPAP